MQWHNIFAICKGHQDFVHNYHNIQIEIFVLSSPCYIQRLLIVNCYNYEHYLSYYSANNYLTCLSCHVSIGFVNLRVLQFISTMRLSSVQDYEPCHNHNLKRLKIPTTFPTLQSALCAFKELKVCPI